MKTQVLYKSRTGNTEKLAKAIFAAVPGSDKDIARLDGQTDYDMADIYFIGFWTDRGSASVEVLDYLGSLQGKKIALFGTCGMGESPEYFKKIEEPAMGVNLIFRIAAVGILVSVICQVLKHSGRDEQAFLTSLAGLVLVLFWMIPYIYDLFETMKNLFAL